MNLLTSVATGLEVAVHAVSEMKRLLTSALTSSHQRERESLAERTRMVWWA